MDYRFDPTHITFRVRRARRYRDRVEARPGKPSTIQWKSARRREARLMLFHRSAVQFEIFNGNMRTVSKENRISNEG